jgi:hypothetical protein
MQRWRVFEVQARESVVFNFRPHVRSAMIACVREDTGDESAITGPTARGVNDSVRPKLGHSVLHGIDDRIRAAVLDQESANVRTQRRDTLSPPWVRLLPALIFHCRPPVRDFP